MTKCLEEQIAEALDLIFDYKDVRAAYKGAYASRNDFEEATERAAKAIIAVVQTFRRDERP